MPSKQRYTATIELEDGKDVLSVDMLNLPYDMFGPKFPLEIIGPVDMGKCKGQPLPDMTNVVIYGEFDCSTCTINADTVLPTGISRLVCKHSINSLDTLIGILPLSLQQVVVRPAVINAVKDCIKKNSTDDSAYKSAIKFMEMYPNITVTDGKKTLAEVIQEHAQPATKKEQKKPEIINTVPQTEQQTDDWLSVNELIPVCEELLGPDLLARLDKDLKRHIRQVLSTKSAVKIETREMQRTDGTKVKCIRKEDANLVAEQIAESVQSQDKAETKDTKKPAKKKPTETKASIEPQKYYIDNREIHPIKIKKYISKAAWGQILSKVGKNITALLDILQDIENINVNPALAHTKSGQVLFIKDNQVQVSPTVGFKNGRCLAQGFGTLDDRPRIVWGICGNTFICQNFYPAHEGKVKLEYNTLLRTIDIDITKIDLKEYLLVSDLIKTIKAERPVPKQETKADINKKVTEDETDAQPKIISTETPEKTEASAVEPTPVVPEQKTITPRTRRSRIVKTAITATPAEAEVTKTAPDAVPPTSKEEATSAERTYKWASLYHLNGRLTAKYKVIIRNQQELLRALSTQTDTEQLLQTTQKLQQILETKKKIEDAQKQIEQKNAELFEFIQKIDTDLR